MPLQGVLGPVVRLIRLRPGAHGCILLDRVSVGHCWGITEHRDLIFLGKLDLPFLLAWSLGISRSEIIFVVTSWTKRKNSSFQHLRWVVREMVGFMSSVNTEQLPSTPSNSITSALCANSTIPGSMNISSHRQPLPSVVGHIYCWNCVKFPFQHQDHRVLHQVPSTAMSNSREGSST